MIYQWIVNKNQRVSTELIWGVGCCTFAMQSRNNVLLLLGVMTEGVNTKSHTGDGR